MRKNKKRRRIVAGVVVFLLVAGYLTAVNMLVSAALVPSFMEKLEAFERITEESYAALAQTPKIEENRRTALTDAQKWFRSVQLKKPAINTGDGYRLIAAEFPAEKESHRWVILLHGYTGWKEEMYPFAYWYATEGYHILVPDLRCQGESEGDFIGMGWTDHFDCMLWIQYILSCDKDAQIVLHGQSMGAATALMMTGDEALPANVRAVVSDCAYTDACSMFGEKAKEWFHLPAFPVVDTARILLKLRGGYDLKDASALDAVKKSATPTLFIHGDSDAMISVEMSEQLYEAAACDKELLIVEGAGHAQSQDIDPDAYYGAVRTFLQSHLPEGGQTGS